MFVTLLFIHFVEWIQTVQTHNNHTIFNYICRRKCKGQWDLSSFDDDDNDSSDNDEVLSLGSSDFPSDLSINEEEWTDYLTFQQQEQEFDANDLLLDLPMDRVDLVYWNEFYKSLRMRARRGIEFKRSEVLKGHADLSFVMRAKLINWIFEVHKTRYIV